MNQFDHEKLDVYLDASNKSGIADEHVVKNGRAKLLRIVSMLIKLSKRHRYA